ncbi:hypothetical protein RDI58_024229 [Solanum bulbocastanum]|uniref:Uncharacterized protein n=1 Tax=Solanum bulbocastanum TaxID=147425 RepID=A0AAN8T2L7_SOLBU
MSSSLQSLEFGDGIKEVLKTCEFDIANPSMESPGSHKQSVNQKRKPGWIEEEKKDVPKKPAAVLTSQRKEVKAKSSVRKVYSQSVRLARNLCRNQAHKRMKNQEPSHLMRFLKKLMKV